MKPLYCVDGTAPAAEEELELPGYRGSHPVRVGNAATEQLQLDNYGHLLESASRLRGATGSLGTDAGALLARFADFVAYAWRQPDAGIWEVRDGQHDFVQSKAMCWTALDRAATLAAEGALPDRGSTWRAAADAVREWIEDEGWDENRGTYLPAPISPGQPTRRCSRSRFAPIRAPASRASLRRSRRSAASFRPAARSSIGRPVQSNEKARSSPARSGSWTCCAGPVAWMKATR